MIGDKKQDNGGFTYVEILICLVIIALIVTPISYSFLTAVKIRVAAVEMDEATTYAEQLLNDIKFQMTEDIMLQQEVLGTRYKTSGKSAAEINKVKEGVAQYLLDWSELPAGVTKRDSVHLNTFLTSLEVTDLAVRYDTNKYAYEVALWRISDVLLTSDTLTLDKDTIKKATKIYSDTDSSYQFQEVNYDVGSMVNPIAFKITSEMLRAFKDDTLSYVPNQVTNEKILDINTIKFGATGMPAVVNKKQKEALPITVEPNIRVGFNEILDSDGTKLGYVFHINEGTVSSTDFPEDRSHYRSIIEVDVRNLLRKSEDLSEITTYDGLTFKFINYTKYNQFIRIKKNLIETEDRDAITSKFNVVVEDKADGKSIITQINDTKPYENYLIAVVVRDKNPVQGQAGKVVKKMINIYSYDINTSKRR